MFEDADEIGKELKAGDLLPRLRTVVALRKGNSNMFLTMWITDVNLPAVTFKANAIHSTLFLLAQPDGLVDDTGAQIHVYEWLGRVVGIPPR